MATVKHLGLGVNYQVGQAANQSGHKGVVDVIFDRAFKSTPKVTMSPEIEGNAPKNGGIKWVNKYGFRYHFGGSNAQVSRVHWSATEVS